MVEGKDSADAIDMESYVREVCECKCRQRVIGAQMMM